MVKAASNAVAVAILHKGYDLVQVTSNRRRQMDVQIVDRRRVTFSTTRIISSFSKSRTYGLSPASSALAAQFVDSSAAASTSAL